MDNVKINISGTVFLATRKTILNIPESKLAAALSTDENYDSTTDMIFFDRRPGLFESILAAHMEGEAHFPSTGCASEFVQELEFWNLPEAIVGPCCIGKLKKAIAEREVARAVVEEISSDANKSLKIRAECAGWQRKKLDAWLFMEFPVSSKLAKAWSVFMGLVIAGSLISYGLMFDERIMYRDKYGTLILEAKAFENVLALVNSHKWRIIWTGSRWCGVYAIDIILNTILTVEFITRIVVCPYKKKLLISITTIIDAVLFTSYILGLVLMIGATMINSAAVNGSQWLWVVCVILQMFRPIRIIRLANTFVGLRILLMVLRRSIYELFTVILCLGVWMMVFAFLIFAVEIGTEGKFETVWAGAWWAVVTMTTVGYGDMVPQGTGGYIVGCLCVVSGVVIIALSIPIATGSFNIYYDDVNMEMAKLQKKLRKALDVS